MDPTVTLRIQRGVVMRTNYSFGRIDFLALPTKPRSANAYMVRQLGIQTLALWLYGCHTRDAADSPRSEERTRLVSGLDTLRWIVGIHNRDHQLHLRAPTISCVHP